MNKNAVILLVEDFQVMRKAQIKVLASLGYENVIEAQDGEAAVDILKTRSPDEAAKAIDLIISDWNMPNMDGLEFLKWVRADKKFKDTPFIIATAQAEMRQAAKAREAGVSAFITKPFEISELASAIKTAMQTPGEPAEPQAEPALTRETYIVSQDDDSIRFKISSEMRLVDQVAAESRWFLKRLGFETFSEFKLALRELLINAIEHGNRNQPSLTVDCVISLLPGGESIFKITVTDQGKGFDHRSLDMSIPQDSRQIRNRGFAIVNAFSRKIEFNEPGNQVTAYIKLEKETQFDVVEEGDWTVIRPTGDITASVADKFRAMLDRLVEKGWTCFRFDLSRVRDIDSVGLSSFLLLHKILLNENPQLEMINVRKDLCRFFQMVRLDRSYAIRPDPRGDQ